MNLHAVRCAAAGFAAVMLASACRRPPAIPAPPPYEGAASMTRAVRGEEKAYDFVTYSPGLEGKLSIDRQGQSRDSAGRFHLQVLIRNRTGYVQAVEVQTVFRDGGGFDLGDTTGWTRLILEPKATTVYQIASRDDRAAQYVVHLREAN